MTGNDSPSRYWRLAVVILLVVLLCDQLTKLWVVARGNPLAIVGSTVEFRVVRNSGGAFSLFTNATVVLAVLAIVLSLVLARAVSRAKDRLTVLAFSLLLAGALGNLCDRLFRSPGFMRGHVVDFIHIGSFPSFNVADSAITIGAILLIISTLKAPPATPEISSA